MRLQNFNKLRHTNNTEFTDLMANYEAPVTLICEEH